MVTCESVVDFAQLHHQLLLGELLGATSEEVLHRGVLCKHQREGFCECGSERVEKDLAVRFALFVSRVVPKLLREIAAGQKGERRAAKRLVRLLAADSEHEPIGHSRNSEAR